MKIELTRDELIIIQDLVSKEKMNIVFDRIKVDEEEKEIVINLNTKLREQLNK